MSKVLWLTVVVAAVAFGGCRTARPVAASPAVSDSPSSEASICGRVGVVGTLLTVDRGTEHGLTHSQKMTICYVREVRGKRTRTPLAEACVRPAERSGILNLNTVNVVDEDGDLVVREFRRDPVAFAKTHELVAISRCEVHAKSAETKFGSDGEGRGKVIGSSLIEE